MLANKQYIGDLQPGDSVEAVFRLRDFKTDVTKNQDLYARGVLRDMSGDAEMVWFGLWQRSADEVAQSTYVLVKGKADQRNGKIQIRVNSMAHYDIDQADEYHFAPTSFMPLDVMQDKLNIYITSVKQPYLKLLLKNILRKILCLLKSTVHILHLYQIIIILNMV